MNQDDNKFLALSQLARRYRDGNFTPPTYVARYVLQWQLLRHGHRFAQRRSRHDAKPNGSVWIAQLDSLASNDATAFLIDVLEKYDLRSVSRRVNVALAAWLRGEWRLCLCERIPETREVLRMQIDGTRPVTIIAEYPRLLEPVDDKADAFAFACHDLEHAWQFFHDSERHVAQRQFAQELERALEHGVFTPYVTDAEFVRKFEYLAADMNTHIAHSLQYLRAILLDFHLRAEAKTSTDRLAPESREQLRQCMANFSATAQYIPEVVL